MQVHDVASFESALSEMLASAAAENKVNRISVSELREWTVGYLCDHQEETKRFPETQNAPHWNLFAYDNPSEDALFVIVTFTSDYFGILAGRGNPSEVRSFGENFNGEMLAAIEAVRKRFPETSQMLEIPIQKAYGWIEYD